MSDSQVSFYAIAALRRARLSDEMSGHGGWEVGTPQITSLPDVPPGGGGGSRRCSSRTPWILKCLAV